MTSEIQVGVLGEKNMRWYLGGQLLSLTGTMLQAAVLSLLVLSIAPSNGAFWVGVVGALDLLPGALLGPFAGTLLDAFNKRKVLLVTAAFGIAQALVLAFLTYTHTANLLLVCILALFMGLVNAVDGPGRNAIIKDAVQNIYNVRPASKMFSSLYTLAQIVGPGLAGFLILFFGYPLTFVLNAFSFVGLVVALWAMHFSVTITPMSKSLGGITKDAAHYIAGHAGIWVSIVLTGLVSIFGYFYYPILAVVARDLFHGGPIAYSYLAAAAGGGSLIGSVVIIRLKIRNRLLVIGGMFGTGIALMLLSHSSTLFVGVPLIAVIGFSFMICFSSLRSSIMHIAAQEYIGVVLGYTFSSFYGGVVVGSFLAGIVSNTYGASVALLAGGAILTVIGFVSIFLPGLKQLD